MMGAALMAVLLIALPGAAIEMQPLPRSDCGRGPVVATVTDCIYEDCNHCGPQLSRRSDGGYDVFHPTMCTAMACGCKNVTRSEAWSDWPECGGRPL